MSKARIASFCVPVLAVVTLLYQAFTTLQIALLDPASLIVAGTCVGIAAIAGLAAAAGPAAVRVGVLALTVVAVADVTFGLDGVFDDLRPEVRLSVQRDSKRISDLYTIAAGLDEHLRRFGRLPLPEEYGEGTGLPEYWMNWWDTSAHDGDGDGRPFLPFLVDTGLLPGVPVDPLNTPSADGDPRGGRQYVYFAVPPAYDYEGGVCDEAAGRWMYMLAVTDLELDRTPGTSSGTCACLWKNRPGFFMSQFDYVICGTAEPGADGRADGDR